MTHKQKNMTNQERFMQRQKNHRIQISSARLILLAAFLALWEISSCLGWIDSFFFSSPSRVVNCCIALWKEQALTIHIGITLLETFISFLLVFLISLVFSTALWYSNKLSEIIEPYLVLLNSLPKSALAPLFIVWLGTGFTTIVVAGISVALFGSIISFYTAFRQCDPEKITLIHTLGGTKRDAFIKVVFPSSIPILISTTKVNIGLALVGVIIGEFLAARRGLGYLIIYGSQVFQLDMVISGILLLCIISMAFYKGIQVIEYHIRQKLQA